MAQPLRVSGSAAELPERVLILKWGENLGRTTEARIIVDESTVETLSANQELVACDRVPMDYEHQSVPGHPNYKADPRLSPGSGQIEVVTGEGVYLSAITYTGNGQEMADSYQDVSAVVHLSKDGHPLWISSVALTQCGDVAGLEFSQSIAALSARHSTIPKSTTMKNTAVPPAAAAATGPAADAANYRAIICNLLGLTPDCSEEDLVAAVTEEAGEGEVEPTTPAALSAATKLRKALPAGDSVALAARMDAFEKRELVNTATAAGKVIPLTAEEIAATPVAILSAMISKLPAGEVPLEVSAGAREATGSKIVALSADEAKAAKALGLTDDEYRKGKA